MKFHYNVSKLFYLNKLFLVLFKFKFHLCYFHLYHFFAIFQGILVEKSLFLRYWLVDLSIFWTSRPPNGTLRLHVLHQIYAFFLLCLCFEFLFFSRLGCLKHSFSPSHRNGSSFLFFSKNLFGIGESSPDGSATIASVMQAWTSLSTAKDSLPVACCF